MRKDIETDFWTLANDTMRTVIKVIIASLVFVEVGHVEYSVAVSTACLLGMTDFFSKKRDLKTPKTVKAKVVETKIVRKFSATSVSVSHSESNGESRSRVSVSHIEGESS